MQRPGEFVPEARGPVRATQLIRDRKTRRPGVDERVSPAPASLRVPLLMAKLHLEIAELAEEPEDAAEHGDVAELLFALASACGHSEDALRRALSAKPLRPHARHSPSELAASLHMALASTRDGVAGDLSDASRFASFLAVLEETADRAGLTREAAEAARAEKAERLGAFSKGMLWADLRFRDFTPELGQAAFGQPSHPHEVPEIMLAALSAIGEEYGRVYWNRHQKECPSPFGNHGTSLVTEAFSVHAYSWGYEEQPWNFKWRDLRISWYKWCGRGTSSNVPVTPEMAADCLEDCLAAIRAMESDTCDDDFPGFVDLS